MKIREIKYHAIAEQVKKLAIQIAVELPEDVLAALRAAAEKETSPRAKRILEQLIENSRAAQDEKLPLCQDTGLAVVFIRMGAQAAIVPPPDRPAATIIDAVNEGIAAGYKEGILRKSVVADPLFERINTQTNMPAIVHLSIIPGDQIHIGLMAKGGGCENRSRVKMFKPTDNKKGIGDWIVDVVCAAGADACPPFVVGVGLGGNFEQSCILSKKALFRKIGSENPHPAYGAMEKELLETINRCGPGAQGLGGTTTALGLFIETAPCHIASLPAAVNIECHSHRHGEVSL